MRKKNRTLGTRLTEKAKDLFTENYKTSLKEMKGRVNKGKATSGHGLENFMLLKRQNTQRNLQLQCTLYKSQYRFCKNGKIHPNIKTPMESHGIPNSQNNLEKEKGGGITLSDSKTC